MKRLRRLYIIVVALYLLIILSVNVFLKSSTQAEIGERNVVINRIASAIQKEMYLAENADANQLVEKHFFDKLAEYKRIYKEYELPQSIIYIHSDSTENLMELEGKQKIIAIKNSENKNAGFLLFVFEDYLAKKTVIYVNVGLIGLLLLFLVYVVFFDKRILVPFEQLSEYPERLSKGLITEKLPENKRKYFGKFIWGINMLNDKIITDNKRINKLIQERQTLLTTLAHGIKTPVANVKLYASAIDTGLYQKNGIPNEEDAAIAKKIGRNADAITDIVKEMLENTSKGMVAFEAKPQMFYVKELADYIEEEYANRLKILHIPYTIHLETEAMIHSDKDGLIRILSQLMENAIKYGSGEGIRIEIEKNEEGFFFSIRNKGELVTEKELPYLFNSFWRGTNAELVEGSGIGLFEAKSIALKLGGDIFAKRLADSGEMEFVVYIE